MPRSWAEHGPDATLSNIKQKGGSEKQTLASSIGGYFKGGWGVGGNVSGLRNSTVTHEAVRRRPQRGEQTPQ